MLWNITLYVIFLKCHGLYICPYFDTILLKLYCIISEGCFNIALIIMLPFLKKENVVNDV
jgi:hypothetical protein